MRKVILGLAVSLDGFIEGPNGEYDWCFTDQDYGMRAFLRRIDAIIMGRKTYAVAAAHGDVNPWKGISTYVFSNTLTSVQGSRTFLVSGDVVTRVAALRSSSGKDIWLFGGAQLTASLMQAGLVDEMWLSVHPVLLGRGTPLFHPLRDRKVLRLLESKTYDTGLVSLTYSLQVDTGGRV